MSADSPHFSEAQTLALSKLRSTATLRERAQRLLARARNDQSRWFVLDDGAWDVAVRHVAEVTRQRYPTLQVPVHSRWRHFEAGGIDRRAQLAERLEGLSAPQRAHAYIDLAVVSVLLDAGAGADWHYVEPATGLRFDRSEGLAVASFHAFMAGLFSSDKGRPLQVDSEGLRGLVQAHLASAFQVSDANPLIGLEGRTVLLHRLGEALSAQPEVFGAPGRPGGLFDELVSPEGPATPPTAEIQAHDILSQLLASLSGIWPAGSVHNGVPLGDCWPHPAAGGEGAGAGWLPFHKLSQWLTYSLLEPFAWGGVQVRGIEALTALPEYRNGGLLIDSGVLRLREPAWANQTWQPSDELIVEWRALTVALLDELAPRLRHTLELDEHHLPLAAVLEGGTWAAGRQLAQQLRGGTPPLRVASDGTLF